MNKKRILASFLVVCMLVMNMSTMVVNAAGTTPDPSKRIIISNVKSTTGITLEGKSFAVYKVFDATLDDATLDDGTGVANATIDYTVNTAFADFFKTNAGANDADLNDKAEAYIHAQDTTDKRTELVKKLKAEVDSTGIGAVTTISGTYSGTDAQTMTSGELAPGYYLVLDVTDKTGSNIDTTTLSAGMLVSLPGKNNLGSYAEDVTIDLKGSKPTITKEIWHNDLTNNGTDNIPSNDEGGVVVKEPIGAWDKVADYEIGDTVSYRIKATIPSDLTGYDKDPTDDDKTNPESIKDDYKYIITDSLSTGMAYKSGSLKIYTDAELTKGVANQNHTETIKGVNGTDFITMSFNIAGIKEAIAGIKEFYIYYEATVTDTAKLAGEYETNTVKLEYSNDPYNQTTDEVEDDVKNYTFAFDILKTDSSGVTPLANAVFGLFAREAGENGAEYPIYLDEVPAGSNEYVVRQTGTTDIGTKAGLIVTDATGEFKIKGLDDATAYIIREIQAPTGYVKADDVQFTITADYNVATELLDQITVDNAHITVSNDKLSTTIKNVSSVELPGTGGSGTIIFIVTGSVLMLMAAAFLLVGRKKTEKRVRR